MVINNTNYIPNEDNMRKIAQILEVKFNEPFRIQLFRRNKPDGAWYWITANGLMYSYTKEGKWMGSSLSLEKLLIGKHQVVRGY